MSFLEIINIIKEASLSMPNVHTFRRDFLELNREDTEYSAVVLQDRDSVIDRLNEQNWITYSFHFGYVDRLTDDGGNRDAVISTGIIVLTSIINSIRNSFGSELDVIVEDRIVTFDQRFLAQCSGVYLVLGVRLPLSDCEDPAQTDLYDTFEAKITENGQYHFVPDGKPVDEINITIDVPSGKKPEESLETNIYANGMYEYTPSEGSVFDSVTVNVSVPQSGKLETTFSVTPSTQDQTILPEPGYVFSSGVVSAVSADIDSNIVSSNIRSGVSILGVEGTMNPQKTEETLSRTITANGSYSYSPSSGSVFGSASINVNVTSIIPKPANDEIYYVSYDGNIITPTKTSGFGNVYPVSNTVHSSGNYCVLKFSGVVTNTGLESFEDKLELKEIYLPDSVTVISPSSFANTGLQKCAMQDTVTDIASHAFTNCFALVSPFRISEGCTEIGGGYWAVFGECFENCTALVSITIPSSVSEIGRAVFRGCTNLRDVVVQAETPPFLRISEGSTYLQFDGCTNLQRIRVPQGCVETYKSADGWSTWANLIIEDYD